MQYGPKVHINNTNEAIQSTVDSKHENGEMPFLDCLIKRNTGARWTQQRKGNLHTELDT